MKNRDKFTAYSITEYLRRREVKLYRDFEDAYNYAYLNECYLFIRSEHITVRCDRENTFYEGRTFEYSVHSTRDIDQALTMFHSLAMADVE